MLAAGTMISVRKRQMEEHLGLTTELKTVFTSNPEGEEDLNAIPPELRKRQRKSTVVTQRNSVASIVAKSRAKHDNPWRHNKVLTQLEKMVEDDTTIVTLESFRDKLYFAFQGFPISVVIGEPWPTVASLIVILNLVMVTVSCIELCLTTLAQVQANNGANLFLFIVEAVTTAWFIIDWGIRFALSRTKLVFLKRPMNLVDILTVLPFFADLVLETNVSALAALRVVRLVRVMRLTRLSRSSGGLRDVLTALSNSGPALSLLGFLLIIALFVLSTLAYFAEQTEGATFDYNQRLWIRGDGRISPFQSVYHGMWFTMVTLTTVGYGDAVPVTALGKAVSFFIMLSGVLVIAFPTVILSASFHDAYRNRLTYMTLQRIAQLNGRLIDGDVPTINGAENKEKPAPPAAAIVADVPDAEKWRRRHTILTMEDAATEKAKRLHCIFFKHHETYIANAEPDVTRVPLECEFANPEDYDRASKAVVALHASQSFRKSRAGISTAETSAALDSSIYSSFRLGKRGKAKTTTDASEEAAIPMLAVGEAVSMGSPQSGSTPRHIKLKDIPDEPSRKRRLEHVVGTAPFTNRRAQSDDVIIHGVLFYAPVLQLECVPLTNIIKARVTKTFPQGYTLQVNLLLDSEVIRSVYEAQYVPEEIRQLRKSAGIIDGKKVAVRDASTRDPVSRRLQRAAIRAGKVHSVACKKVKSLTVKLGHSVPQPDGDLVSQCYMAVDTFEAPPTSSVPLTIVATSHAAFKALLNNFELLTFSIDVDYQEHREVELGFGNMKLLSVVRKERTNSLTGTNVDSPLDSTINPFAEPL